MSPVTCIGTEMTGHALYLVQYLNFWLKRIDDHFQKYVSVEYGLLSHCEEVVAVYVVLSESAYFNWQDSRRFLANISGRLMAEYSMLAYWANSDDKSRRWLTGLNCLRRTPAASRIAALYMRQLAEQNVALELAYIFVHVVTLRVNHFRDANLGNLDSTSQAGTSGTSPVSM